MKVLLATINFVLLLLCVSTMVSIAADTTQSSGVSNSTASSSPHVQVYHYVIHYWGKSYEGPQDCGANVTCEWTFAENIKLLRAALDHNTSITKDTVTVSLYNIHSWWEKHRDHKPAVCELPTNLTMVESEESRTRYHGLFDPSFKHFDGFSSTYPTAHVQRVYLEAYLNEVDLLPLRPFPNLVKAAAYVASDCHKRDNANANRDGVVKALKQNGLRVDGLGRCMHSIGPEGISLPDTPEARYNLTIKREVVSHFLFYLAFENSIEPGYVTEKPFDGLMAGSVPVYLGDASRLRELLPDPKAVIFESDFNGNHTALTQYLLYLQSNETAYEEHRAWRHKYSSTAHMNRNIHLQRSWQCKVCDWAVMSATQHHKRHKICGHHPHHTNQQHGGAVASAPTVSLAELEGKPVRGNSKKVYLVKNGVLHFIPDLNTFMSLKLSFGDVIVLPDNEMATMKEGKPLHKGAN